MRVGLALILVAMACLAVSATPPGWVVQGVAAVYDVLSTEISGGEYGAGTVSQATVQVSAVSGNLVTGTVFVEKEMDSGPGTHSPWTCTEGEACEWRIWVDPLNPTASIKGKNGEALGVVGRMPYSYAGFNADEATVMSYRDDAAGINYEATFDTRTGLLLSYTEKNGTVETSMNLKSINRDLTDYAPPETAGGLCPGVFSVLLPLIGLAAIFSRNGRATA